MGILFQGNCKQDHSPPLHQEWRSGISGLEHIRSPGEVATIPSQPKPGNEAFSKMAAILLLNEDAKVVNGILKMGRQPAHGINLEDNPRVPRH